MKFLKELQADTEINEKVSFPLMLQFIVPRAISFQLCFQETHMGKKISYHSLPRGKRD